MKQINEKIKGAESQNLEFEEKFFTSIYSEF